jgi:hypothetical protein
LKVSDASLAPDETHKFAKACTEFLKDNENDYYKLSTILKEMIKGIRLVPLNPLLKLVRIRSFNLFLTTAYDEFLSNVVKKLRVVSTKSLSHNIKQRVFQLLNAELFNSLENSQCTLIYSLFGSFEKNLKPAYTEMDILDTILDFYRDMEVDIRNNLFQKMRNSSMLFIGCDYEDWLYRFFIRVISNKPHQYSSTKGNYIFVADNFRENSKLSKFLMDSGTQIFYSNNRGNNFVGILFEKMAERYPEEIISISDFPKLVFISFEGSNRQAALKLFSQLKKDGIMVWLDEEKFKPGDRLHSTIVEELDKCSIFIPLVSRESSEFQMDDGRVKYHLFEWERAYSNIKSGNNRQTIIPVKIDDSGWVYDKFKDFHHFQIAKGDPNLAPREYERLLSSIRQFTSDVNNY